MFLNLVLLAFFKNLLLTSGAFLFIGLVLLIFIKVWKRLSEVLGALTK